MSSVAENKQVATELFARFDANDLAGALDTLADDATWWMAGKPELLSVAGPHTKAEMAQILTGMAKQLKDGLRMTVKNAIGEGDQVAVEVESHGELRNGRVYNNLYHFLITVRDGKVSEIKEYYDTHHVFATWIEG